jgi:endonuclease YncB( thermonuclease family)
MFLKAKKIVVETQYIKTFARFEADVFLDGMDLAEHLLTEGFADLS